MDQQHHVDLSVSRNLELSSRIQYLSDRHTTHTRVQYACPCVGAHLAGEREPFPPSYTVGLHRLSVRGNHTALCKVRHDAFVVHELHVGISNVNLQLGR